MIMYWTFCTGSPQSCVLSPLLFILLTHSIEQSGVKDGVEGHTQVKEDQDGD